MLDFGWAELLFIMAVVILLIGPQDIPKIMYGLGRLVRRFQYIRFALSRQFDEFMQSHDLEDLRRSVNFEAGDYSAGDTDQLHDEAAIDEAAMDEDAYEEKDIPGRQVPEEKAKES